MNFSSFTRYAGACAAALLAACSGVPQVDAPAVPASTFQSAAQSSYPLGKLFTLARSTKMGRVPTIHHRAGKSWIRPGAGKEYLLYASDLGSGTIDIYNYRDKGKLYGQISGLDEPYGQCVDTSGNVYVADEGAAAVDEFAHGDTKPLKSVRDDYGKPIGCSVDPKTGNIAVANFSGRSGGSGGIDVLKGGLRGTQTYYTDPSAYYMWPPGYDLNGNIFVEGQNASSTANVLLELPSGRSSFTTIGGVTIGFPAAVQRWKHFMAVADQGYLGGNTDAIYTVDISGSRASIVKTTQLTDRCYPRENYFDAVQPFIGGLNKKHNTVVAGNIECTNRMDFFEFPDGAYPDRWLPRKIAPDDSWGQSISPPVST